MTTSFLTQLQALSTSFTSFTSSTRSMQSLAAVAFAGFASACGGPIEIEGENATEEAAYAFELEGEAADEQALHSYPRCRTLRRGYRSENDNRELVLDFYAQVLNGHDAEAAAEFLRPDYIQHNPMVGQGLEGFQNFFVGFFQAAPDVEFEIFDIVVEDDRVTLRVNATGTYNGPFGEMTVENRAFDFGMIDIFRLEDGMLAEHWDVTDNLTFLSQLGAL